ncbi:MAG: hypothetical protein IPO78_02600 [Saprospiraceae bacterium]|nr:hypothetical protein [Saprospiraceae bacterium]
MCRNKNIDNPLTVPEQENIPENELKFQLLEDLKEELLYGVPEDQRETIKAQLLELGLVYKAASFIKSKKEPNPEAPEQWHWPQVHFFIKALIALNEKSVFYEWSHVLEKRQACFPGNCIYELLEWGSKDLDFAEMILPSLGELCQFLAPFYSEFSIFSKDLQKQAFLFPKKEQKLFAFKQFRKQNPKEAFEYFKLQFPNLKGTEKQNALWILKYGLTESEIIELRTVCDTKKQVILLELIKLNLCLPETAFYKTTKSNFQTKLAQGNLDQFQFENFSIKQTECTIEQIIKVLPLSLIQNEEEALKYIDWIEKNDQENALLNAMKSYPDSNFSYWYFNILLAQDRLNENFPTALLSSGLDHIKFTKACIKWIDETGDALDVEAFLHFINSEKHFWSDELLVKIIGLRKNLALERKYDFDIFWQLLPYKLNPNSNYVKSIPSECKIHFNKLIHFETIISFRKLIRNMKSN